MNFINSVQKTWEKSYLCVLVARSIIPENDFAMKIISSQRQAILFNNNGVTKSGNVTQGGVVIPIIRTIIPVGKWRAYPALSSNLAI